MELALSIGIGVGLASVAGVRAFLPLALVGLFAQLGFFDLPEGPFALLGEWAVIGALFALSVLEAVLDKLPGLDPVLDYALTPLRIVSGAALFAVALGVGLSVGSAPELAAGGVVAGLVSVLKAAWRPPAKRASAGVSAAFLSGAEDVVALVGGVVAVFVPYLPLVLVGFLLFFFFRLRRRRGRQYAGLRILRD